MNKPEERPEEHMDNDDNIEDFPEDDTPESGSFEEAFIASGDAEASDDNPLQAEVEALQAELAKTKDHMLRALAETENVRKRAIKEREDAGKFAVSRFAKDLLDFADNFKRALQSIPADLADADPRIKAVIEGILAMDQEMLKTFEKHGITKIEPLDEPFDPNFHEVMFEAPVPNKPAGIIIEVIEAGYILNGRLLRPARVGVAKDGPSPKVDTKA